MKSNHYQCYQLAAALNRKEWKQFVRETLDGRRTQHAGTQALIKTLENHYPDFDLADETILSHPAFLPNQSAAQLRVLRTNLKHLISDFLVQIAVNRDQLLKERLMIEELTKREQIKLADIHLQKSLKKLPEKMMDIQYLNHARELQRHNLALYARIRSRQGQFNWLKLINWLEIYTHVRKLIFLSGWQGQAWFKPEQISALEEKTASTLKAIEQFGPDRNLLLEIYYHLLSLLAGKDQAFHDDSLQQCIRTHRKDLEKIELINILGLQINYLIHADLKGIPDALKRAFAVYRFMVEQDLLFDMGAFSVNSTRNILSFGVRLGELAWTGEFLHIAQERLQKEEAEKFYPYGQAYLCFAKGDYPGVRRALRTANFQDPFYSIAQRVLALRTYYMEEDWEMFQNEQATFTRQLYRNKRLSSTYSRSLLNFLKVIGQVYLFKTEGKPDESSLKECLQFTYDNQLPHRDWLRREMKALQEGR